MKPDNAVTKFEVAVMSKDRVAEHLMKGKSKKFLKNRCFFLRADVSNMTVKINGKFANKAKEKGIEVLCTTTFAVSKHMLSKLKAVL